MSVLNIRFTITFVDEQKTKESEININYFLYAY